MVLPALEKRWMRPGKMGGFGGLANAATALSEYPNASMGRIGPTVMMDGVVSFSGFPAIFVDAEPIKLSVESLVVLYAE